MTLRSSFSRRLVQHGSACLRAMVLSILVAGTLPVLTGPARAQVIALAVNGDPITTLDLDQRMKLLRALRRPASRDAAIESMIADRLKTHEAIRYGVNIKDNEIGEAVTTLATKMKTTPQALLADIQRNGVEKDHFVGFFKAELAFDVLVKALNKGVEASEVAVRAELAKGGGKAAVTEYKMRQVVLTLNPSDGEAAIAARAREAEALRAKFSSCATGLPYARSLEGVAVREPLTRTSSSLSGPLRELLDKTPIGHLTPPSRSSSGLEMVAICERGAPKDDSELRKVIGDRLLQAHIDEDAAARLKDMRSRAVVEKR